MPKFTFKTEKPTGRWKAFEPTFHYIKLDGAKVGEISHNAPHRIRFMVIKDDINEDGNPNCIWKWITLKKKAGSLDEAKDFIKTNAAAIRAKLNIFMDR